MNAQWTSLIDVAGWTLLHFVWQGTLAALGLGLALSVLPRRWARARYVLACLTLVAMAVLPAATASYLAAHPAERQGIVFARSEAPAIPVPARIAAHTRRRRHPPIVSARTCSFRAVLSVRLRRHRHPPGSPGSSGSGSWACASARFDSPAGGGTRAGWCVTMRSRPTRRGSARCSRLSTRLRLHRTVRLLESARVQVPIVIGSLKPVLLLPAAAMTGLSPQQVEAVLAHELAHIRRHDYLVNLVQSIVETVLFYHPGVWWVSHTIRVEREHCCDDLAVSVCGDALLYARALTNIETLRHERIGIAMAVSSGSLLSRVRRLLGVRPPARLAASGWVVLSLTAILVAAAGAAGWLGGALKLTPAFTEPAEAATTAGGSDLRDAAAGASSRTERGTGAARRTSPQVMPAPNRTDGQDSRGSTPRCATSNGRSRERWRMHNGKRSAHSANLNPAWTQPCARPSVGFSRVSSTPSRRSSARRACRWTTALARRFAGRWTRPYDGSRRDGETSSNTPGSWPNRPWRCSVTRSARTGPTDGA